MIGSLPSLRIYITHLDITHEYDIITPPLAADATHTHHERSGSVGTRG